MHLHSALAFGQSHTAKPLFDSAQEYLICRVLSNPEADEDSPQVRKLERIYNERLHVFFRGVFFFFGWASHSAVVKGPASICAVGASHTDSSCYIIVTIMVGHIVATISGSAYGRDRTAAERTDT